MVQHFAAHQAALASARELADTETLGRVLGALGSSYRYLGHLDDAESCLRESLVHYRAVGNRQGEASTLISLGNLEARNRQVEAIETFALAMVIAQETGHVRYQGICLLNSGASFRRIGQPAEALRLCTEAMPIVREHDGRMSELSLLRNIAEAYVDIGDVDQAIQHYREHDERSTTVGADFERADTLWTSAIS